MTPRAATTTLLLAALAVAPAGAGAIELRARAGLLYSRVDEWRPDGLATEPRPHLDLDLALDAAGVVVSRDVARYRLSGEWGRITNDTGASTDTTDHLSYSGTVSILENPVSPISLSAFASRGETEFTTSADDAFFGNGTSMTTGGALVLKPGQRPALITSYTRTDQEARVAGEPLRETLTQALSSSLSFGTPAFQLTARYDGEFREGSWETDRSSRHDVALEGSAPLGPSAISLTARSSLTIPEELVPGTYEQQVTSFGAYLRRNSGLGHRRTFAYGYGHTSLESPGVPTVEITRNGLRYEGDHFVRSERFSTIWLVDLSAEEGRTGDLEPLRTTGETFGVSGAFRRKGDTTVEIDAGPRVSMIQSDAGDSGGWGASARFRLKRPVGAHTFQADYGASYGDDLYATAGWQLTQSLGASLGGRLGTAQYNAGVHANAFRSRSPSRGDGAGRSVQLNGTLQLQRTSLNARVTMTEGIVGATPEAFASDGLLLPAPFNSRTVNASLDLRTRLYPGLHAKLAGRYGLSDVPSRPLLSQMGASGGLTYRYGALGMSLEDRLSREETDVGWRTSNVVMFSFFRSFGGPG